MADRAGYDQPENKHISNYPTSREGTLPSYQVIGTQQQTGFFQPSVPYQSAHVANILADEGHYEEARMMSNIARNLLIISIVLGCVCIITVAAIQL